MSGPAEEALLDALRSVDDPEAGMNIVDLGLIYGIEAAPPTATVRMTMTSAACPLGDYLTDAVRDALRARFPELEEVNVELVWEPPWTPALMSGEARDFFGWK
jgi:metal-sulfur cluster biosynthetic enzyme